MFRCRQAKSGNVHLINLLGENQLILGEDLFSLYRYCNKKGMRMTLNTNGTLLTEEVARKLFIFRMPWADCKY